VNARPALRPADVEAVAHVFVDALDDRCEISGTDGHHLQRVRRLTPGEAVTAADGSGAWRSYEIVDVAAGILVLEARTETYIASNAPIDVSLAVALTKSGLEDVVAATTELGVARVIPVRTARTVVRWDEARAARAVGRFRAVARESAMQSRRATIPIVDEVTELKALVGRPGIVVADLSGVAPGALEVDAATGWTVLVGPEGGLSPDELSLFRDAPRVTLGRGVLRASTAPIAAVAVLLGEARRLGPE
jgi:16S rRNA (uracil1498-N3)-methyltransferase